MSAADEIAVGGGETGAHTASGNNRDRDHGPLGTADSPHLRPNPYDDSIDLDWDEVWVIYMPSLTDVGQRRWFKCWHSSGPQGTDDEALAATFPSEAVALKSRACSFWGGKPERIAP